MVNVVLKEENLKKMVEAIKLNTKDELINEITELVLKYGNNCGNNYYKQDVRPFKLSLRYTNGSSDYGSNIEFYGEPSVMSLRYNKNRLYAVLFVHYGIEQLDLINITEHELNILYVNLVEEINIFKEKQKKYQNEK